MNDFQRPFAAAVLMLAAGCAAPRPKTAPVAPAAPKAARAVVPSATPAAAPTPVSAPKGARHKFWGDVQSIDAATGKFTVKSRTGHTMAFRVASTAKLTKGGDDSAIASADLAGAHVRVTYAGDVAVAVHVIVK